MKQIQQGYPIKLVIPSEGAGYEIEVSALMKTSQNKADARKFLDWLLTPTAAKLYGERAELSTVPGSKPPPEVLATGMPADPSTDLTDYLRGPFPECPVGTATDLGAVEIVATDPIGGADPTPTKGWKYSTGSGEFIINDSSTSASDQGPYDEF